MLEFHVNPRPADSTMIPDEAGSVRVRGMVTAGLPLNRAEIAANGDGVHTQIPDVGADAVDIGHRVHMAWSGWAAIRAHGPGYRDLPAGHGFGHPGQRMLMSTVLRLPHRGMLPVLWRRSTDCMNT